MMHKAWCSLEEVPYCFPRSSIKFQGHTGWKIDDLDQIWARLLGRSQLSNPSDLPCFHIWTPIPGLKVTFIFMQVSRGCLWRPWQCRSWFPTRGFCQHAWRHPGLCARWGASVRGLEDYHKDTICGQSACGHCGNVYNRGLATTKIQQYPSCSRSRPKWDVCHSAGDIFKYSFCTFGLKFYLILSQRIPFTISQHWLR